VQFYEHSVPQDVRLYNKDFHDCAQIRRTFLAILQTKAIKRCKIVLFKGYNKAIGLRDHDMIVGDTIEDIF